MPTMQLSSANMAAAKICVVQQLKQNGDAATIRWLLSAKQLREMERVVFQPECSPFRTTDCYSSEDYYDDY